MSDRTDTFYPADAAIHGYGTQLLVSKPGTGSPPVGEVWEAIAAITNITPGEMATEDIDRTHLRSPDAHREHMPGLRDSGPFSCVAIWLPLEESQSNAGGGTGPFTAGGLVAMWRNRTTHQFKIRFNTASPPIEWPFKAYVSKFQPGEIGAEDKINATVEFRPTQAYDADLP